MRKNVASQKIGAQMVSAADGSAFTGSVTVYVTVDAGTQSAGSVGSGACTHEGNGYHTYAPAQAETNGNLVAFTFTGTGAIPQTIQVETVSFDPHDTDGLGLSRIDAAVTTRLAPTTAGRTLDVSAGGEAGVDWANVGSPTTTVNLSGTTISTSQAVASVSGAVGSVTGAVGSVTGNVGGNVTGSVGSVVGAVGSVTGNVGGNVTGSVGSVTTGGISAASFAAGAIDAAAIAADAGTEIATAVWNAGTRTLTSGGGGSTQVHLVGGWGKSGSTYYWQGAVIVDGSIVTTGISSPAVVGVYGNNANTDLGYVAGTAPTVGTAARLYGSFTLTTAPTDGQPAVLEITFVYNATTYRGRLYSWGIA